MSKIGSVILGVIAIFLGWHFEHLIALGDLPDSGVNMFQAYGLIGLGFFLILAPAAFDQLTALAKKGETVAETGAQKAWTFGQGIGSGLPHIGAPFPGTVNKADPTAAKAHAAMKTDIDTLTTLAASYPEKERELKAVAEFIMDKMFKKEDPPSDVGIVKGGAA